MLFHHLDDLFPSIVQPTYRTDRVILPDDDDLFFGIINVLCAVALADCKDGMFRNLVCLRKADLTLCHLLKRKAPYFLRSTVLFWWSYQESKRTF